jgi:ABC-2 type transport system ATP-binding protein
LKPSLKITDLSKRYGENALILSGLDYTFTPGTATGLVGANGAGKTTFLKILSTSAFPTGGRVSYGELDIHKDVHRYLAQVGIVGDTGDLPQFLTAQELVEAVVRQRGLWSEGSSAPQIDALFSRVELDERRGSLIGTYSSGMMQKTMIAAALAAKPEILLLDEPFRALDESAVRSVMVILKEFVSGGGILLISSHQRDYLEELCSEYISFPYLK